MTTLRATLTSSERLQSNKICPAPGLYLFMPKYRAVYGPFEKHTQREMFMKQTGGTFTMFEKLPSEEDQTEESETYLTGTY